MTTPHRLWSRFSLRTLFVVVTVLGCWMSYSMNWIRQRHALLETATTVTTQPGTASVGLWLLGEGGFKTIDCLVEKDVEAFKRLFPEAEVRHFEGCIVE